MGGAVSVQMVWMAQVISVKVKSVIGIMGVGLGKRRINKEITEKIIR